MTDFQNPDYDPLNPEDAARRDGRMDGRPANVIAGWIAAVVLVVAVLAVGFGLMRQPGGTNTASNDRAPPTAPTHMAPPAAPSQLAPAPPAPISPTPDGAIQPAPAQPSGQ